MIEEAISKVVERIDLSEEEMEGVMAEMMEARATPSQVAAILVALRMKGETIAEIVGAARVMREKCVKLAPSDPRAVDLCGTGGDRLDTFNVSTVASFIVAGAGVSVAKHGNRSVSSRVGSADVLEELGVNLELSPEQAERCLNEVGIVFLYAPLYHPSMKNVATPRREIGIRTIFNVLGPMTNPAGVKHQVMGVYSGVLLEPIAKALRSLGSERAMVVHGDDGTDEITVTSKTSVAELKEGIVKCYTIEPEEFGLRRSRLEELQGGDARRNAQITLSILRGEEDGAKRDISLINAAAAIAVSGKASDLREGLEMAVEAVDSGRALAKLNELVKFSREAGGVGADE